MVFKIMKAAASFYAVAYNENKQEKGLAENVYFQNFGYLQEQSAAIKAASAFFAVDYNENKQNKGHSQIIHRQNFPGVEENQSITKNDIKKYLDDYSAKNSRIKNPQFHAILSCKGNENTFAELKNHALELMNRMGYANNPMLIYEHKDTKNNHIHIVTSRVGPNGRKINHDLEGKRANKILNDILKIDNKQNYKRALDKSLSYNISTTAQFKLLMEHQGYNVKETDDKINFYRHGTGQGSIDIDQVKEKIQNRKLDSKRTDQIKAFIHKYKITHDSALVKDKNPNIHTSVKPSYHSDLTNHLRDNLGIQFIFHADKDKQPYGYTIIDHAQKAVYKGSEVMKLEELRKPLTIEQKSDQELFPSNKTHNEAQSVKKEGNTTSEFLINTGLSCVVSNTLKEVDSEVNLQGSKKKRKNQRKL